VQVLIHTGVVNYMEFQPVAGSYVYRGGDVHKVPNTGKDAMNSVRPSPIRRQRMLLHSF
jgi:Rab GDP dissociation inhibitor